MVAYLIGMTPQKKVAMAAWLLRLTMIGWPATHALMVITDPPEQSWVFHLLLAISWLAIALAAMGILFTTEVRRYVDDGDG